jgi:hypothetical protein
MEKLAIAKALQKQFVIKQAKSEMSLAKLSPCLSLIQIVNMYFA